MALQIASHCQHFIYPIVLFFLFITIRNLEYSYFLSAICGCLLPLDLSSLRTGTMYVLLFPI